MSAPPKWEHILCAQLLPTREVQVAALAGTHNPVGALQELILFLNHAPFFFARTQGEERSVQRVTHANNACRLSQQPRPHGIPP